MRLAIFVVLVWLSSSLAMLVNFDFFDRASENRNWAQCPPLIQLVRHPRGYFEKVNACAADHFGFRSTFLRFNSLLKFFVFRESPSDLVLIGKDNVLFWAGEDSLTNYRNLRSFSEDELRATIENLVKAQNELEQMGAKFLVIIPPDTATVYGEYLPDWLSKASEVSLRDQLIAASQLTLDMPILDFKPALSAARQQYDTYKRTDSHWTQWGGLVAFNEISKNYAKKILPLQDFNIGQFEIVRTQTKGEDLARVMALSDYFPEWPVDVVPPKNRTYTQTEMYGERNFVTHCQNCRPSKVLMIRDSFGIALEKPISTTFQDVTYIWDGANHAKVKRSFLNDIKPDLVIFELVERKIRSGIGFEIVD